MLKPALKLTPTLLLLAKTTETDLPCSVALYEAWRRRGSRREQFPPYWLLI